jgi:hypothetical protein
LSSRGKAGDCGKVVAFFQMALRDECSFPIAIRVIALFAGAMGSSFTGRLGWICTFAFLFAALIVPLKGELLLQPNDRVAICGDGAYTNLFEEALLMSRPVDGLDLSWFGWSPGAGSPGAFLKRLDTDLLPYKPSVVLLYFTTADPATREADMTALVEALKKAGVREIVIGSPACVDSQHFKNDPAQAAAYNQATAAIVEIDKKVAAKEGVAYADVFRATLETMTRAKAAYGKDFPYGSPDPFGPSEGERLVTSCAFLKALGCTDPIGTFTLDFATKTATVSPGQQVVSYDGYTLNAMSTRQAVHFPGYPSGRSDPDPILKFAPYNDVTNKMILVVRNLPTAKTKVDWADESHDYLSADLARGVNLTGTMLNRQFAGQSENAGSFVYKMMQGEQAAGAALVAGKPDPDAEKKRLAALQAARDGLAPMKFTLNLVPLATPMTRPKAPINIIVDTDMSSDVDDAGAVALLNSFMVQGECKIIGAAIDVQNQPLSSGAVVQAIDAWYGHPDIPIGVYHGEAKTGVQMTSILTPAPPEGYHGPARVDGSTYTLPLHQKFNPAFPTDDKLPEGVDVYRKALAGAKDDSVVIVTIGVIPILQDLIQSQPDSVSPLSGLDLIRKKVNALVVMGNTTYADAYIYGKWPTKILWTLGLGTTVYTGKSLAAAPEDNPIRFAYEHFGTPEHNAMKDGRGSWDLTAAWASVRGGGEMWDEVPGNWRPDPPPGYGTWIGDVKSHNSQLISNMNGDQVNQIIDTELARPPKP